MRDNFLKTKGVVQATVNQVEDKLEVLFKNIQEKKMNLLIYMREQEEISKVLQQKRDEIEKFEHILEENAQIIL